MANLLGQTFFLLHDGKFCKEKLEAGPGFQFSILQIVQGKFPGAGTSKDLIFFLLVK